MSPQNARYSQQAALDKADEDFLRFTSTSEFRSLPNQLLTEAPPAAPREIPRLLTIDQSLLNDVFLRLDRLKWLNEGPDSYKPIDDTITSTQESRYNFNPYLLWSLNVFNNATSGGPSLLLRFTDSLGRVDQYKVVAGASFSLKDMRGSMGSLFRVVATSASAEMIGFVTLRWPYGYTTPLEVVTPVTQ